MSERDIKEAISKIVKCAWEADLAFEFTEGRIEIWAEDGNDLWEYYCGETGRITEATA